MKHNMDEFNFCSSKQCDVVYYSNDLSELFLQKDIKSKVTIKNEDPKTPLCYCKKLLKKNVIEMIENNEKNIASKIKTIISKGKIFCEKSNPKGTCCTTQIADFLSKYAISFDNIDKYHKIIKYK